MIKAFLFRILRFVGVIAVIYISMVFYMVLTERRNAFPRAITHTEANQAIASKVQNVSCTLEDGTLLGGWIMGDRQTPVILYYPDAEEDAAQFLAEIGEFPAATIITFNYRGSGENKGTPSQKFFEADARQIAECASQINSTGVSYFAGRGTGAILAAQQKSKTANYILFDPVFSIKDAIASKYRALYPSFLIRVNVSVDSTTLKEIDSRTTIVFDRAPKEERTQKYSVNFITAKKVFRKGGLLRDNLFQIITHQNSI